MKHRGGFYILAFAFAAMLAAPVAVLRADFVDLHEATIPVHGTNWTELVTIPKFDSNLGVLTLVVVRVSASLEAHILAENWSSNPANITAALTQTITVTPIAPVPPLMPLAAAASIDQSTQIVAAHDGVPFGGPDTAYWDLGPVVAADEDTYTDGDLTAFVGPGNVDFQVSATAQFSVSSNTANVLVAVSSQAGSTVKVEYHYIPEPTTLALLLTAAIVTGRRRRRRG